MGFVIYVDGDLLEHAGAFETEEEAYDWAEEHLNEHGVPEYEVVPFE